MLTQYESTASAPAAVSGAAKKLPQLFHKRLRQLLRVILGLAICLVVAAGALAIWWLTSLNGLPDIGEPFDVAALRAFSVPDDHNAFTYFRRASAKVTLVRGMWADEGADPGESTFSWSIAKPTLREWAGKNREAFELFQQGAEQPDAANPAGDSTTDVYGGNLITLAMLEASRRQESGDTAGAWDCYRSVLRTITHFRRRGNTRQRELARAVSRMLQRRLTDWATGPGTTISQLHTTLEFVLENEPNPDWDLFAVKYGYLELLGAMDRPIPPSAQQGIEGEWTFRLGDMSLSPEMVGLLDAARRFLLREPERSRRVLRLLCANYLAHVESRERPPRRPAVWAIFSYLDSSIPITTRKIGVPLYPVSPEAPAGARALPPQEVAGWLVASVDAKLRLLRGYDEWLPPVRARDPRTVADRKAHRELVIMLATEIYRREGGSLPPSEEALVGTYLKSLPEDGSTDLAGKTTADEPPTYEVYAVRYATLIDFPVSALVQGAEPGRKLDIAMTIWVLKGPVGRTVLVDAGFYRPRLLKKGNGVVDYTRPDKALERLGIKPEEVTDVIVTHMHWDHADGVDLFPKAQVWIQKDEFNHHTREAKVPSGHERNDELDEASAMVKLNVQGRVHLVDGDAREILPGVTVYTGGRHTFASQYVGVNTKEGCVVIASDNLYLYENLDKHVPIAQTLDAKSNLAAQDRMKRLATSPRLIVPGHDPEVFVRFPKPGNGMARVE